MFGDSLRARLTFWYTGLLALVLVSFAVVSYVVIAGGAERFEDETVRGAAQALGSAIAEETAHVETAPAPTPASLDRDVAAVVRAFRFPGCRFFVLGVDGALLATSDVRSEDAQRDRAESLIAAFDSARGTPTTVGTERVFVHRQMTDAGPYTVVVAHSLADEARRVAQVRRAFAIAVPVALLCAALGGSFLARASLRAVAQMGEQAERIEASSLHERLRVRNERDELGRLARAFNALLARLEGSFEQQRRFMADASHELRTPVAIVRGEAEVALSRGDRTPEDYRESLEIIHDEGRRLTTIVDDLFLLARADAGQRPLVRTDVDLADVLAESVRAVRSLADRRGVTVTLAPAGSMPLHGDEDLLVRMVVNLLDNAIKYTPPGGVVAVETATRGDRYVVDVRDTGSGIPASAQPHVFDRFYRADASRARRATDDAGGAGLGLSIARWIAEAHGGSLVLEASSELGTTFEMTVPTPESRRQR